MSIYTEIRDGVFAWTNRSDLTTETDTAIRQAIRTAHRSGSFYRDLVILPLTALPTDQTQIIDLSSAAPDFRQLATCGPTGYDFQYDVTDISDLFDADKYPKTDICYGVGTNLMIRASSPVQDVTLTYWKNPVVSPIASTDSWIADMHQDLIILWAAATVLTMIGEQEIKTRVEALAKLAMQDLIEDSLSIVRR